MQMDFSCSKFALVAQISTEQISLWRATKASATCRSYDRSFPCSTALDLHVMNLHDEAKHAISCTACNLYFESREQRDEHMMQSHDGPQVVSEFLRSSEESDPRAGRVTREEFLLVLGLKALPIVDDGVDDDIPQKLVAKAVDVDANQNLLKTMEIGANTSLSLPSPLVVGSLMALTSPVGPVLPSTVPVPSVLSHSLPLVSSHTVASSAFRLISTSDSLAFLNTGSNSIQSIAAMAGAFPFISPLVSAASVERQSPGAASNMSKTCASSSTPARAASDDGGKKFSEGSDAEDSNKTSTYW